MRCLRPCDPAPRGGHNPAPRVASLLPSATESVCALAMGEALVGVSHECDFAAEHARAFLRFDPA